MVSLTLGGSTNHFPGGEYGDLRETGSETMIMTRCMSSVSPHTYFAFRRSEAKRNDYFFEFPGLFVRTEIFRHCHAIAKMYYSGQSVEMGLTSAYFYAGYDLDYYKCSIAKLNLAYIIEHNPNAFIRECRLLENLDPNQGNSSSGGNHYF
jgi:hypothetical protein